MADRDVLVPLVNDREGQPSGLSQIEQAIFEARAPYVLETVQMFEEARRESKHIQEQAALSAPGLQNIQFIGKTRDASRATRCATRPSPTTCARTRCRISATS